MRSWARRRDAAWVGVALALGVSTLGGVGLAQPASAPPASAPPASAPPASAPSTPGTPDAAPAAEAPEEVALRRYAEGRKLLEAGDFAGAQVELRASFEVLPSPNTELLIGHAQRLGGERGPAAATYQHVAVSAGEKVRAGEDRYQPTLEEAGRWLATLRAELTEIEVFVANAPPGTEVAIDGAVVAAQAQARGLSVRLLHEPGPVAVIARAPDGRTVSGSADGPVGARVSIDLDLGASAAPPPEPRGGLGPPPLASWIAGGVGVAGFAVFGIFGAMSSSAASDLDACAPRCPASQKDTADGGARDQTIANVGLVVGAVGLVSAGVLWLTWPDDEPAPARATAAPGSVRLRVSPAGAADATLVF